MRSTENTRVNRRRALVICPPEEDTIFDGNAFYWMDHFKVKSGKKKQILLWRNDPEYIIFLSVAAKSDVKMTFDVYGNPIVTEFGEPVDSPPIIPRNLCPDKFRLPSYAIFMDGEYDPNGFHSGSLRLDIGFSGDLSDNMRIMAHHPSTPTGSLIEVKNIDDIDGEFNILINWEEIHVGEVDE